MSSNYNFDTLTDNAWVLPIVKHARMNDLISKRASFDLGDEAVYRIVSFIMKNTFAQVLRVLELPGQVYKERDRYVWYPHGEHSCGWLRHEDDNNFALTENLSRFKSEIVDRREELQVDQLSEEVVGLYREWIDVFAEVNLGVNVSSMKFQMAFNLQTLTYKNDVIAQINKIKQVFGLYKKILNTYGRGLWQNQ